MIINKKIIFLITISITISLIIPSITSSHQINLNNNISLKKETTYDFTIAWMTDTQIYSQKYPHIFNNITNWIVKNQNKLNITYLVHTGDLIQYFPRLIEWLRASRSMNKLEKNNIPYGVLAGNHDNSYGTFNLYYNLFFGKWRYQKKYYYGGYYQSNQNHYDIINTNEINFVIIYLSYNINQNEIDWANNILQQHQDKHAILAVHEYIKKGGYYTGQGEEIFNNIVKPNNNIFMVLCGHKHDVERNTKIIEGRTIHEILANYQEEPNGGNGYIRLLQFSIKEEAIYVKTYSPYLDDYNYHDPEEDEFTLFFNPT